MRFCSSRPGRVLTILPYGDSITEGYLSDTVHPNDTGHAWMASVWYPAIKAAL